jgi:hypothetical protein
MGRITETGFEVVYWVEVSCGKGQWQAFMITIINLRLPYKRGALDQLDKYRMLEQDAMTWCFLDKWLFVT